MNIDDLALELECGYCCSPPNVWCVTKSGKRAGWLHGARTHLIQEAWSEGFREGHHDGLSLVVSWFKERRHGSRWARHVPLAGLDIIAFLEKQAARWKR